MHIRRQGLTCLVAALLLWPFLGTLAGAQTPGSTGSSSRPGNVVDYDGLLRLLAQKVSQKEIIQLLEDSPTHFTLSEEQVETLRARGASPEMLAVLQRLSVRSVPSDVRNIGIVLDCSGSMLDRLPDGSAKMDVAKKVVTEFIRRIRNGKNLTFIVYGLEPKKYKCKDVHVVQPLAPVTDEMKDRLEKYIRDIVPLGHTPLAYSMEVAGEQLEKGQGLCMLVVITDGMESCKGDPGAVAKQLVQKLDLPGGVDLIGLGVEPEEMKALKALALSGALTIHEVDQAAELAKRLKEAQEAARRKAEEQDLARRKAEQEAEKYYEKRLKEEGAKSGELEVALVWFNKNDLDLHVIPPSGEEIFWNHKQSRCGGKLDVDMNVQYATAKARPVEHIVWDKKAPAGRYKIYVEHYRNHGYPDTRDPSRFVVKVKANGKTTSFPGQVTFSDPARRKVFVHEFVLDKSGRPIKGKSSQASDSSDSPPREKGWVSLFNGRDLGGWKTPAREPGQWEVRDGVLIGRGRERSHLFSPRGNYQNFHFLIEARISDKGNSGQYFRAQFGPGWPKGYEAQINSTHPDPQRTGSLYGLAPVKQMLVPPGVWFTQEVIAVGNHIIIKVDGKKVVDYVDKENRYTKGHFAIQQHPPGPGAEESIIEVRKIEVLELPSTKE